MSSFQQLSDLKAVKKAFAEQAKRRAQEEEKAHEREREENFFRHAMKDLGVTPLEKTDANRVSHNIKKPVRIPMAKDVERAEVLRATMSDDADPLLFLESDDGLFFHREGVSPDLPRKLYRGKFTVEAHVDLHGLTVDEARDTVTAFLSENQARNHRCVRIVHGKGYGSVGGQSILKELVRRWLKQRREVMCFVEAPPNDGGGGAVLVLLSQAPRR